MKIRDGENLKHPPPRDENTKPYFYCPYHKNSELNAFLPFHSDDMFPCNIKYCMCRNINGWLVECKSCGRLIHNCIHGCKMGIPLTDFKKEPINILVKHYDSYHVSQPVLLFW